MKYEPLKIFMLDEMRKKPKWEFSYSKNLTNFENKENVFSISEDYSRGLLFKKH